jgi:hypothetical protein
MARRCYRVRSRRCRTVRSLDCTAAKIATIEARDAERLGSLSVADRDVVASYLLDRFGTLFE